MDLKTAASIVYAGAPGNLEDTMHHKDAVAAFEPSRPLAENADADQQKLIDMNESLGLLTSAITMQRQLLESTLSEAQREVFRDYRANIFARDQLVTTVEIQMRKVAQHRRTSRV